MPRRISIVGRINGATNAYLGNSRNHALMEGNQFASHQRIHRELYNNGRRAKGLATG